MGPLRTCRFPLKLVRAFALLITFGTGFSGLVYEVTWHRYLSNFIGSQAQAAAIILAVFLGGLCVGYALFGVFSERRSPKTLIATCGWIEVGIGAWAILFPVFYNWLWQKQGVLPHGDSLSALFDVLLCVVLIGLPTVLMGGTLPLLTQGLSRDLNDSSPFHARVYAINTGGAFLGCLAGGFLLLPQLGLSTTIYSMAALNIVAGVLLLLLSTVLSQERACRDPEEFDPREALPEKHLPIGKALIVATLAGLYSISLQTVFIRLVGISMGASEYAFSMVVSVFVLMLALGAWRIAGKRGEERIPLWLNQFIVLLGCSALFFVIPTWAYGSHFVRTLLTSNHINFYVYHGILFILLAVLLAIPIGAMGSTMPLLFGVTRSRFDKLGTIVGKLYAVNTLGCVFGALVGGHVLLYIFNLDQIFLFSLMCVGITLILVFPWKDPDRRALRLPVLTCLAATFLSPALFGSWEKERFAMGTFRFRETTPVSHQGIAKFYEEFIGDNHVLAYDDGPNTSVAVVGSKKFETSANKKGAPPYRALYVNGKSDGFTSMPDLRTTRLLAHLPALLSPENNRRAAVIGFGTGITPGSLTIYPDIARVDCIEISPAVQKVAPWFSFANRDVTSNPKFHWKVGDAYRVLSSAKEPYSLIISEPSNPWVTGVEKLYTTDFYRIVKQSLTARGVYAQWIHRYAISNETLGLVYRSFASAFPEVRTFQTGRDLILIGAKEPLSASVLQSIEERIQNPLLVSELKEIEISSTPALLALEVPVPPALFRAGETHTLAFPKLAYAAGQDFFLGQTAEIHTELQNHYLKPWTYAKSSSLLLSYWLETQSNDALALRTVAETVCATEPAAFPSDWHKRPPLCSSSLLALYARTGEMPQGGPSIGHASLLEKLRETAREELIPASSTAEAKAVISLFPSAHSTFNPFSAESLVEFALPCFQDNSREALWCRVRLIEALAWTRHVELASELLSALESASKPHLSPKVLRGLNRLVYEARLAKTAIQNGSRTPHQRVVLK